ncbi:hypothetical protein L0244_01295, partial [bacterium]|nr:hypothetical protein [bacterium]
NAPMAGKTGISQMYSSIDYRTPVVARLLMFLAGQVIAPRQHTIASLLSQRDKEILPQSKRRGRAFSR